MRIFYINIASPKCRGFITHGGLLSMQESIMNGVPMIAMPVFAEQEYNAYRLQRTGRGIKLEMYTLTEMQLKDAIQEILTNKT
jgi:glucuronosyltransferase